MNITDIQIVVNDISEESYNTSDKTKLDVIFDYSAPIKLRLDLLSNITDNNEILNITNRLQSLYYLVGVSTMKEYIIEIAKDDRLHSTIRIECSKCIGDIVLYRNVINSIMNIHNFEKSFYGYIFDAILWLCRLNKYLYEMYNHLQYIVLLEDVDSSFKYTYIRLMNNDNNNNIKEFSYRLFKDFITLSENKEDIYIILSCQLLLSHNHFRENAINILLQILQNDYPEVLQANAADMLLLYCQNDEDNNAYNIARQMIRFLGENNKYNSVYEDNQNVHNSSINNSVMSIIENLYEKYKDYNPSNITTIEEELLEHTHVLEKESIKNAINRINIDLAVFSKYECTLTNILQLVWIYISQQNEELSCEMKTRLCEELYEMDALCSSGHCSRIINSISGFGEYTVSISYEDQIYSYIYNKFIKIIQETLDDNFREEVNNAIIEDEEICNKEVIHNFLMVYETNQLLSIIYDEYKDLLDNKILIKYINSGINKFFGVEIR
jgi:hypothetical protein